MSNTTNSSADAITFPLAPEELYGVYSTCLWTGSAAPNFANERTGVAVVKIANYVASNPNVTNATLAEFMGTDEETATIYTSMFGGMVPYGFGDTIFHVGEILQVIDHPTTTSAVAPLYVVFTILTTIVIALRIYSRKTIAGRIMSFDWAILVGYVLTVIWGALAVRHSQAIGKFAAFYDQSFNQYRDYMTYYFTLFALYPITMFAIKLSLLLFYFEMSSWKALRIAVGITLAVSFGNAVGSFFAWIFQCDRLRYWDDEFGITCRVDIMGLTVSTSAINIATDIVIWGLPMPLVARLQLYPRERLLAIFTFGFGAFACVASGFRLQAIRDHVVYSFKSTSPLMIDIWTIIELNLAIICASAPALRALVVAKAPKILSSYGYGSSGYKSSDDRSCNGGSAIGRSRFGSYSLKGGPFGYKADKSAGSRNNSSSHDDEGRLRDLSISHSHNESTGDVLVSEKPQSGSRGRHPDAAGQGTRGTDRTRSGSRGKLSQPANTGLVKTYGGAYSAHVDRDFNYSGAVPLRPPRPAPPQPLMPQSRRADDRHSSEEANSYMYSAPRTPNGRRVQTGWSPMGPRDVVMV